MPAIYVVLLAIFTFNAIAIDCTYLMKADIGHEQVLIVQGVGGFYANVTLCDKLNGVWHASLPTYKAVIGKNGIAPLNFKVEGDEKTPSGIFKIGEVFGTYPAAHFKFGLNMDYKYIVNAKDKQGFYVDKFIDDIHSPYYNSWVAGEVNRVHFEQMYNPSVYRLGFVIQYNMYPAIPGRGSAIFAHVSLGEDIPTKGCISMKEQQIFSIIRKLNKQKQPVVLITY
jgi:L,D-peptidoglycan transpeptidase YkuD (ErfK/YbiS/YcfS/YnhG family)